MNPYLDFFMAILPLVILIYMMTKKKSVPSNVALPLTALMVYVLRLVYFGSLPNLMNATMVKVTLEALTPITIIWGAIILFKTMDLSGQQAVVNRWLNQVSGNRVAQLMIIGWAFAFMILWIYNQEGTIIKRTVIPMLIYGEIAAAMSVAFAMVIGA